VIDIADFMKRHYGVIVEVKMMVMSDYLGAANSKSEIVGNALSPRDDVVLTWEAIKR
jgi:hypothetical protein